MGETLGEQYEKMLQSLEGGDLLAMLTPAKDFLRPGLTRAIFDPRPIPGTDHTYRVIRLLDEDGEIGRDFLLSNPLFYDAATEEFFYASNPLELFTCFDWDYDDEDDEDDEDDDDDIDDEDDEDDEDDDDDIDDECCGDLECDSECGTCPRNTYPHEEELT